MSAFPELEQAEQLLLKPTAENLDRVTSLFTSLTERVTNSSLRIETSRLSRLRILLQGALQLRLGSARASVAGLSGYAPGGLTNTATSFGSGAPLARV